MRSPSCHWHSGLPWSVPSQCDCQCHWQWPGPGRSSGLPTNPDRSVPGTEGGISRLGDDGKCQRDGRTLAAGHCPASNFCGVNTVPTRSRDRTPASWGSHRHPSPSPLSGPPQCGPPDNQAQVVTCRWGSWCALPRRAASQNLSQVLPQPMRSPKLQPLFCASQGRSTWQRLLAVHPLVVPALDCYWVVRPARNKALLERPVFPAGRPCCLARCSAVAPSPTTTYSHARTYAPARWCQRTTSHIATRMPELMHCSVRPAARDANASDNG
jgi:hypothetical protein